jgi:putative transposase
MERGEAFSKTWRTTHGDLTDEEWELIGDLVAPYSGEGRIGRPIRNDRRAIVNAIFYVAATGCQWRALPACYPNWNTVHRYHLTWSRNGTWERICDRLRGLVREQEGREPEPSASVIDARSVRGAATVTAASRGYDAGKKISGRKTFGVVDTLGLLVGVVVVVASTSDNAGGIAAICRRY